MNITLLSSVAARREFLGLISVVTMGQGWIRVQKGRKISSRQTTKKFNINCNLKFLVLSFEPFPVRPI